MSEKKKFFKNRLTSAEYIRGILAGDRVILSRAITLIESKLPSDNELADSIIDQLLPETGDSLRIGITGVPGSGKSTFIETYGQLLTSEGKKVAVLTIDPTSQVSKGSILGDKTRMETLANDPNAYVRPSASGDTLGGVHSKTRETMLLCEAAGFDIIVIETVGVGQSETAIRQIVDFFLLIALSGAGDELQGIKRGIMEMADTIVINKADGDNTKNAQRTRMDYVNALHMFPPTISGWTPKVLTCSALENSGFEEILKMIQEYQTQTQNSGFFDQNRKNQNLEWMRSLIRQHILADFYNTPGLIEEVKNIEKKVFEGELPAMTGAKKLIRHFRES